MSSDAFTIPLAPQSAANSVNRPQGTDSAPLKLDRSAQPANQKKDFLATLNHVSENRSCGHDRANAAGRHPRQSAKSHRETIHPAATDSPADQEGLQHGANESELTEFIPESLHVCERQVMDLMQLLLAMDGSWLDQGLNQPVKPIYAEGLQALMGRNQPVKPIYAEGLQALMGRNQPDGQMYLSELTATDPFEQLQTAIAPEAGILLHIKQLINRAIVYQFAARQSDSNVDHSILAFWRSVAAMPVEGAVPEDQTQKMVNRIDTLLNFLRQRFDQLSQPSETAATAVEDDGNQTFLKGQTVNSKEDLFWQKIMRVAQPADTSSTQMIPATGAAKDSRPSVEAAKVFQPETLVEAHVNKPKLQTQPAGSHTVAKAVEPAVTPNAAAGNNASKLTQEMVSSKPSGMQNDLLAADQTGSKVIQIDGEAKDSGFLASQESLPEHLTKLEHAGRSAEGAQRSMLAQTMNQIVQKAVLLNNNGQNTVQIDLKPDFLGHIRMQIVSEGQQVAVRIMAEIPFVKDMLENNLNQLKTELQAQGLEVDELEVSVAHDSRADDDLYQKAAEARRTRASKSNAHSPDASAEEHGSTRPVSGRGVVDSTIDFFA